MSKYYQTPRNSPATPAVWQQRLFYIFQLIAVAALYYASLQLGDTIEMGRRGVMILPLAAGVGLAALLLFGARLWVGILLGSLLYQSTLDIPSNTALFTALANVSESIIAVYLLEYYKFPVSLSRVRDVFLFTLVVCVISPLCGATLSALKFFVVPELAAIPADYISVIWVTDWFKDGIGMLIITSTLLVWRHLPPVLLEGKARQLFELIFLLLGLAVVSGLTLKVEQGQRIVFLYMILPFAIWAAVRFREHGATLAALLIAGILMSGSINNIYDTNAATHGTAYFLLEIAFIVITSFTAFLVAAAYSERREAEESLFREKEQAITTLHSIADGVITTDAKGYITYLNPIAEELLNYANSEAVGMHVSRLLVLKGLEPDATIENPVERALHGVVSSPRQSLLINQNKQEIPIENSAAPIRNRQGQIEGVIMVFHDVSKEHHLRQQLSHQASHDALTGLFNRREFEYQLSSLLNHAKTEGSEHSFLYLDLDQFKIVNDTCGHIAGDSLLKQLVTVIQARVRSGDTFARLGGDEFGILLKNCPIERAGMVADAFLKTIRNFRFVWQDKSFEVGASIGAVPIVADSESSTAVLSKADLACYAAKEAGRNRVHVHIGDDASLVAVRQSEMQWVGHILKAIEEDRIVLFQQQIVPVNRNNPESHCEILMRMRDENGAFIPPGTFLPAAERYNLMPKLDRLVVHKVFKHLASLPQVIDNTLHDFVAVNLSGATMNDPSFAQFILDELQTYPVPTRLICFEITETAAISSLDKAALFMQEMTKLGFRFALDDFGSGVSSFGYLKQLPVDYLKIDGRFVKDMLNDPIDKAIVESINQIGHVMSIKTIAEWVEDEATLLLLDEIGVDFAQGFGIAKPQLYI